MLFAAHGIGFIKLDVDNPADSQVLIPARERDEIDWDMANRLATENRDFLEYVKLVKQFYQTGEARPADWDVPETGTDGLFQMADHVEAFISTLKRPEPAIARVGARAAHQQREPRSRALGGGEVGGVEFGLAHQRRGHRLHGRFEQVEQMFLQAGVDVARGHVVNDGVLESVTHGQCSVVGTDVMNALFGLKAKRIRDGTIRCCEVVKR